MDSRATRALTVLVVSSLLGGCRHAPRPVASSGTPTPSPTVMPAAPTPTPPRTAHPSPPARASSPSATPGPARACTTSEITVGIRTTKASYAPGDLIVFAITATNIGAVRCRVDVEGLYVTITDPDGRPIQMEPERVPGIPNPGYASQSPPSTSPPPAGQPHRPEVRIDARDLRPGERFTEDCDWDGSVADPANAPYGSKRAAPGTYHATAHWQYPRVTSAPVAFRLD